MTGDYNHDMSDPPAAVFGFPTLWDEVFREYSDIYLAIDKVQRFVPDLAKASLSWPVPSAASCLPTP